MTMDSESSILNGREKAEATSPLFLASRKPRTQHRQFYPHSAFGELQRLGRRVDLDFHAPPLALRRMLPVPADDVPEATRANPTRHHGDVRIIQALVLVATRLP